MTPTLWDDFMITSRLSCDQKTSGCTPIPLLSSVSMLRDPEFVVRKRCGRMLISVQYCQSRHRSRGVGCVMTSKLWVTLNMYQMLTLSSWELRHNKHYIPSNPRDERIGRQLWMSRCPPQNLYVMQGLLAYFNHNGDYLLNAMQYLQAREF